MPLFEGNELLGLIDRMRSAFVGRDEIIQRGADVTVNTGLAYGSGLQHVIQFTTATKDTDGFFNLLSFPDRLTMKVAGWYVCSLNMAVSSTPTFGYELIASIRKNGSTSIAITNQITAAGKLSYLNAARVVYLNSNDYLQLIFQHDYTPGNLTMFSTAYSPVFTLVRFP